MKHRKYKGYIAIDFDSVIATYDRPFVFDKLGEPNIEVIDTIKYFYNEGYYIYIFTGRLETPTILKWLKDNKVKYHSFNSAPFVYPNCSKAKPYYDVIVDDKAVNYCSRNNKKSKSQLIKDMKRILDRHEEKI